MDEVFNCTVTFNGNGATPGAVSVQTVGRGIETRLNVNTYEKTQHRFVGWNTEPDGSGTPYSDGQKIRAAGNITLYAQWELIPIILDENLYHWTDGNVYILNSDVTIDYAIIVSGSVTLILNDGCTLTVTKSIVVNEGNSLTINASGEGTGTLEVPKGYGGYAGIGGEYGCAGGAITINGGTVNASGTGGGAGIGGGSHGAVGTITINGGTVNASGNSGGAGIGGGNGGAGGTITINGGTVNASGIYGGIGIGSGLGGADDGTLKLGSGVSLEVSSDGSSWSDYDGSTRQYYMRTK